MVSERNRNPKRKKKIAGVGNLKACSSECREKSRLEVFRERASCAKVWIMGSKRRFIGKGGEGAKPLCVVSSLSFKHAPGPSSSNGQGFSTKSNYCLTSAYAIEKRNDPRKVCHCINCPSLKRRGFSVEKRPQEEILEGATGALGDWGADVVSLIFVPRAMIGGEPPSLPRSSATS